MIKTGKITKQTPCEETGKRGGKLRKSGSVLHKNLPDVKLGLKELAKNV